MSLLFDENAREILKWPHIIKKIIKLVNVIEISTGRASKIENVTP